MNFDLLIRNGSVLDGTGAEAVQADIGIRGEKIVEIGNLAGAEATTIIDATGQTVCPGFIDVHSHSDAYLLIDPRASSKVFQGITTEVCGNCGASVAPQLGDAKLPSDWQDKPFPGTWSTVAEYRKLFEQVTPAVNEALLIGHNTLHRGVCGYDPRGAAPDELKAMSRALEQALDEGGFGMSTGLIYPPASAVPREEVVTLSKVCAVKNKIYTSHMRSEGKQLLEAIDEALDIGRRSGVRVQISHLKTSGQANWHKIDAALEKIEAAIAEGLEVAADRYPYTAAQTDLDIILPDWAIQGGAEAELARLADSNVRKQIRDEVLEGRGEFGFSTVMIGSVENPKFHRFKGMKVDDAAKELGMEPVDALLHIIEQDKLRTGGIFFGMCEENMWRILAQPWVMIGCDASLRSPDGILSTDHPHPRAYGSFTKLLRASIDGQTVPLPEMIRKMTSLAAAQFRLKNRGELKAGNFADVVVFNSEAIAEKTTYQNPHQLSEGITTLLVNGTLTIKNGALTNKRNGRFLD
ncbi:N-acyl-D-amino-acid deacylase family protein [Tichowtungia aerotolerans]|uniref:Amidohydrolase family protein n=1 Tax=Tichowtungia aerotolerans TaxID=2697043 RepID=A0A6P1M8I1_9BACT|nr:D-aminoacylase [Tichowtungia aerotolerans]QHI68428.1 amidohydrolase family protein [Tichowtungia aerotolerans]